MEDRKYVSSDFAFGWVHKVVENHELSTEVLNRVPDKVEPKACESVTVGNHNSADRLAIAAFQEGFKTFTFEVESATDVGNNSVAWVLLLHELDLALEVVFLFTWRDTAVTDVDSVACSVFNDVVDVIKPYVSFRTYVFNFTRISPIA